MCRAQARQRPDYGSDDQGCRFRLFEIKLPRSWAETEHRAAVPQRLVDSGRLDTGNVKHEEPGDDRQFERSEAVRAGVGLVPAYRPLLATGLPQTSRNGARAPPIDADHQDPQLAGCLRNETQLP